MGCSQAFSVGALRPHTPGHISFGIKVIWKRNSNSAGIPAELAASSLRELVVPPLGPLARRSRAFVCGSQLAAATGVCAALRPSVKGYKFGKSKLVKLVERQKVSQVCKTNLQPHAVGRWLCQMLKHGQPPLIEGQYQIWGSGAKPRRRFLLNFFRW